MLSDQAGRINRAINAALQEIATKEGVQIRCGGLRYDNMGFRMSIQGKDAVENTTGYGTKTTQTALCLQMAARQGLTTEARNGKVLVDYNPRAHRMPWIYEEVMTGKRYKCDTFTAKTRFQAVAKPAAPTVPVINENPNWEGPQPIAAGAGRYNPQF